MEQMVKLLIPKNRMNYLIKQVQDRYDAVILEEGWDCYHKGRVTNVSLIGGRVEALVKGTQNSKTVIDLEDFPDSECSCSHNGYCKHMAAVFFSLYSPYGRPELILQQLKQAILTRKKSKHAAPSPQDKKLAKPIEPMADQLPQEWQRFFEGKFHGFSISHQNSIETFFDSALETLPLYAEKWNEPLRIVYKLHVILFMMRKIEQFYQDTKSSYLSYYHENGCKLAAEKCQEQLLELIKSIEAKPKNIAAEPKHWQATLTLLGELSLHGKDSPIDWLFIYRLIWWNIDEKLGWSQKEQRRLELLLDKKDLLARKKDTLLIARAHFDVIRGNWEQAFGRLDELHTCNASDFFIYLKNDYQHERYEDTLRWLRWLLPSIHKAAHEDFRSFCQFWLDTAKQLDSDAEWVEVMESLLPRSYYYYTAYLLQTQRYKLWVDLQLANRISPLSLYALELRAIEECDPSLLLPLYHQAVERTVLEKNRTSYKTAVRLLKKLHSYYKQLNQEERWEQFIYRLADKFSRLRAFQEELKKGKWIR
ncbi:SWIM zinc finger family protein [Paenibacillus eucommiae]|uniref:SWIM-type domain-containing protein n=1 Tax=Paenibacillus eucommiae TaxID=1355755 RepID=A0ABS4J4T9_9BACL|nr:SWIM zinc finger family protein [Paenibacillus eucommiae]MBP1994847.1 hypothetical protein [Paenibacillus eucommiae]